MSIGYFGHHGIHIPLLNPSANAWGFASFPAGLCTSSPAHRVPTPDSVKLRNSIRLVFRTTTAWLFPSSIDSAKELSKRIILTAMPWTRPQTVVRDSRSRLRARASPQDPNNIRESYGSAEYDVRHSLNASYVWQLRLKHLLRGHGSDYLVNGWQIAGTVFARTGFPYTVFDGFESSVLNTNNFYGPVYAVPVGPIGSVASCGSGAASPPVPTPVSHLKFWRTGQPLTLKLDLFRPDARQILMRGICRAQQALVADPTCVLRKGVIAFAGQATSILISPL